MFWPRVLSYGVVTLVAGGDYGAIGSLSDVGGQELFEALEDGHLQRQAVF